METTEKSEGYLKLRKIADRNIESGWDAERVNPHFDWVIKRAEHYAEKLELPINDILNAWADDCNYSFLNYFQEANQPEITSDKVKVFDNVDELLKSIGVKEFRCPSCGEVSTDPYECNSGAEMSKGKTCDWKVYGLFGDLGKGVYIYVKDQLKGQSIFMPLSWE